MKVKVKVGVRVKSNRVLTNKLTDDQLDITDQSQDTSMTLGRIVSYCLASSCLASSYLVLSSLALCCVVLCCLVLPCLVLSPPCVVCCVWCIILCVALSCLDFSCLLWRRSGHKGERDQVIGGDECLRRLLFLQ